MFKMFTSKMFSRFFFQTFCFARLNAQTPQSPIVYTAENTSKSLTAV